MNTVSANSLKQEQIKVTKTACKRFELISQDIKIPKLKYLHRSLNFKSNIHYQENEGRTYKYQKYKRGSVVMVNFGTNIGYELSGNHFAIVLNKDDNNKNGVLTVIPLTSKSKPSYLELDDSIQELVLTAQNKYIDMLISTQKLHNQHKKEIDTALADVNTNLNKIEKLMGEDGYILRYKDVLEQMFEENDKYLEKINELSKITEKEGQEIEDNMNKVYLVLEKYNTKNKTSYAMIRNITTVSKLKILKPINKFDPIGKMYISNRSLNKLDLELRKIFTYYQPLPLDENEVNDI